MCFIPIAMSDTQGNVWIITWLDSSEHTLQSDYVFAWINSLSIYGFDQHNDMWIDLVETQQTLMLDTELGSCH